LTLDSFLFTRGAIIIQFFEALDKELRSAGSTQRPGRSHFTVFIDYFFYQVAIFIASEF
jgi:hypothetical protein